MRFVLVYKMFVRLLSKEKFSIFSMLIFKLFHRIYSSRVPVYFPHEYKAQISIICGLKVASKLLRSKGFSGPETETVEFTPNSSYS